MTTAISSAAKAFSPDSGSRVTRLLSTSEDETGPFMLLGRDSVLSGYEAANASPVRGYLWFPTLDGRRSLTSVSDREIRKRIMWLYVNFPFCRRIIKGYAKLIGIQTPQPNTNDDDWNEFVFDHFMAHAGKAGYFDRKGRFDFFTSQIAINEHRYRDGRILGVHTETSTGGAAMAFYEADQICNPPGTDHGFEQGVKTDRHDAHVAYSVRDGKDPSHYVEIDAAHATYFGNFDSFSSIHGVSILISVVCDMMDIVELRGLRKHAAKNAADLGLVIEQEGAALVSAPGTAGAAGPIIAQKYKRPDGKEQTVHYEVLTQQGVVPRLNPGEKIRVVTDDRPSSNNMAFEQALIQSCVMGSVDLPPAALHFVTGMPGPAIRFNMAEINRAIEIRHREQTPERHHYYVRYVAKQIRRYRESGGRVGIPPHPKNAPWWNEVLYIGQPDPTIDRGRDAQATVTRLDAGLTTWTAEYSKDGRFGKRALREKVRETAWLKKEIGKASSEFEVDLSIGEVIPRLAGVGLEDPPVAPVDDPEPMVITEGSPE